jgi:hypothetical protein
MIDRLVNQRRLDISSYLLLFVTTIAPTAPEVVYSQLFRDVGATRGAARLDFDLPGV